ncbi:hypothetical protein [Chitinimonas sp. BJB300]|uniref:hypothetical protein n=1 Tax=Chitinimonas sp. BJB300 TaxID=1559339 RepID=UPI001643083D|nr:hypothetical protein [Chitinimonas sp. BJB300]
MPMGPMAFLARGHGYRSNRPSGKIVYRTWPLSRVATEKRSIWNKDYDWLRL